MSLKSVDAEERWQIRTARFERASKFGWGARVALTFLVILMLASIAAPLLAPDNPLAQSLQARLQGPSSLHWLGTDVDGRDILSRLLYGGRSAFEGVGIALLVTVVLGIPWGLAAGYSSGMVDEILMRLADALLSFPGIVLAIAITGVLGPSLLNAMIAIGVIFAPTIARLLRSAILPLRNAEFVLVARSLNVSAIRIGFRHVLPNAMAPVLVQLISLSSIVLIIQAALAFLGLGIQPPAPSWGGDMALAYSYFTSAPLNTIAPGLALTIGALTLSTVGDGLRDVLILD